MTTEGTQDVTQMLVAWSNGDAGALDSLMQLIYAELHRLASRYMRNEGARSSP